jgi:hypothetical protein
MSNYKRKEVMDYLTRKPTTVQDIELARTRIQIPVTPLPMQETSGESFANEERMGFAKAGLASNEPVKAGELLSYLKKYGVDIHPGNMARAAQMYGIESPSSGKYILPPEDKIKTIKDEWYKNQQRAPATTEIGRENFNERSKLVKELIASEKYNPSEIKDIIQKKYNVDMGNTIQKEINEARKRGKIIPSAKVGETSTNTQKLLYDINLLNENKKIKSILSNPELDFEKDYSKIVNEVKDTLKINDSKANYRLAYLLQAYSDGKIPSNKNIINNSNKVTASITENRPFGSLGSVLRRKLQVEPGVASQINEDPKYFSKSRKEISRKLPGGYATDEIKGLASSFENLTGRYSVFVQGIKGDINLNKGRTIDKLMNTTEKQLQNLDTRDVDYLDKRETIKDKYNERVKEFTNKYNKDLKKGELPVRGLELSFDTPKNSLARYNELKKINPDLIEGVEDIYSKYNYSFKVPADVKIIPEALGFVKSPEGQKLMQKAADVNAARVYADPTGIGNFLETTPGQALSKSAPNLLKATVRLSTITGTPINALLGVALYADEFKEKGLSDLETIAAGAYKGSTQDLLNFGDLIIRKLPVATYEKFVENKPFLESWLDKPELFEFADKQIDKYASEKSIKDRIRNRAEYEVRKSFTPNISDTEVPVTATTKEYENLIKAKENEILNLDSGLKKQYKQETTVTPQPKKDPTQNLMLGPIVFPKYTKEELNFARGGRVKFASGSDDPESDLYIPPLNRSQKPRTEGIIKITEKRLGPEDPLSKYKSYSEEELAGNIEAKKPNFDTLEDYLLNTMPMFEPKDVAPPKSYSPMPVEKYLKERYQIELAEGGPSDPSKRRFIKGTGILGAVGIASNFIPDLFQMAKKAKVIPKKAPFINIVRPLGKTDTEFPEWFPTLVSRFRKEGETIPIYRTEKIPITEKEFNEGIKKTEKVKGEKFYANPRTEEYFRQNPNEFPYYKTKETEDIIGYEYVDKNLPDVKVVEVEGKEASVFFKNYYGADVEINYKSPGVMDEGSFYVKDYQPEAGSALDSAPDFEETFVKNIDEVLGGASQLEKYATKSKTARYTKGDAIADEMEGRAQSELDRMKDEGLFDE